MHRSDAHDHADVGLGDRGQLGDLTGAAHRHLEHEHLGARWRRARISSGTPISVLKLAREATVRRWGESSASSRSFVEVLPVDPVTPITFASSSWRQAVARRCSARSGSSAAISAPGTAHRAASACSGVVSTPHAPAASACGAKRPPSSCSPRRPTNSAPGPAWRESMTARSGPVALGGGRDEPGPCCPCDLLGCPGPHALIREGTGRIGRQRTRRQSAAYGRATTTRSARLRGSRGRR